MATAKAARKPKTSFICRECGDKVPKWTGQCASCGEWNTLEESVELATASSDTRRGQFAGMADVSEIKTLDRVEIDELERLGTGVGELDRVLGGGFVRGSVVLIGGDPGIGKSTLLLQAMAHIEAQESALYVTGEESADQIAMRARRLSLGDSKLALLAENRVETVIPAALKLKPAVMVMDSIQTLYTDSLQSAPGSVVQVRETASQLVRLAKTTGTVVVLVGHVTKEGSLAGPRILEHMVDAVLYFEGDTSTTFRLIRAIKNRYGAVNEIGVFAMTDEGLREVSNPSAMFISRRGDPAPGSSVLATLEGTRPMMVEVQALVDRSGMSNPRRLTVGFEQNRLAMLLAVLHQHAGLALHDQDVFVNVVGGVRISEPAADLAVLMAVASSLRGKALPLGTAVFGEIGLTGEVRPVQRGEDRLREAAKLGFTRAIVPTKNAPKRAPKGITVVTVDRVVQALDELGGDELNS